MKPVLIAVVSAMFSAPLLPSRPVPPLQSRGAASRIEPTDLGRLVWLARADAAKAMGRTEFHFPRPASAARIMADPSSLRAGLTTLMSLSANSMKTGSRRMGLRLFPTPGGVTLELRDAGPGLNVDDLVSMYGSGDSGLSEARRRIERAGGVINVSSGSGAGTVYLIEFPKS